MSDQFYGARFHTSDIAEETDQDTNNPVIDADSNSSQVPVDEDSIDEMPLDSFVAGVGSIYETPVKELAAAEAPVAVVDPVNETSFHEEAPIGEAIIHYEPPTSEVAPVTAAMNAPVIHEAPIGVSTASPAAAALLGREESEHFRTHWNEIQGIFVDEPRAAVQQADALVSEVIEQITRMFTDERSALESQWNQGNDVSTEDLRKALQRYRSFFNRLVV